MGQSRFSNMSQITSMLEACLRSNVNTEIGYGSQLKNGWYSNESTWIEMNHRVGKKNGCKQHSIYVGSNQTSCHVNPVRGGHFIFTRHFVTSPKMQWDWKPAWSTQMHPCRHYCLLLRNCCADTSAIEHNYLFAFEMISFNWCLI